MKEEPGDPEPEPEGKPLLPASDMGGTGDRNDLEEAKKRLHSDAVSIPGTLPISAEPARPIPERASVRNGR